MHCIGYKVSNYSCQWSCDNIKKEALYIHMCQFQIRMQNIFKSCHRACYGILSQSFLCCRHRPPPIIFVKHNVKKLHFIGELKLILI
jgi:hypothetical protein